jgi:hypothetical protein
MTLPPLACITRSSRARDKRAVAALAEPASPSRGLSRCEHSRFLVVRGCRQLRRLRTHARARQRQPTEREKSGERKASAGCKGQKWKREYPSALLDEAKFRALPSRLYVPRPSARLRSRRTAAIRPFLLVGVKGGDIVIWSGRQTQPRPNQPPSQPFFFGPSSSSCCSSSSSSPSSASWASSNGWSSDSLPSSSCAAA